MLYKLLSRMDRRAFDAEVISMTELGPLDDDIRALGIPVHTLGMRRGRPDPRAILQLAQHLRRGCPDVIQTWMYHADLMGGMAAQLAGRIPVVWGVHHTNLEPQHQKSLTIWTARLCGRLSRRLAEAIVCCSEASQRVHAELGYANERMVVIPNGFDLDRFHPDLRAREDVRRELGLPHETPLIGHIGRFHPQKDHQTFLQAAALLYMQEPDVHFVLCGDGVTWGNQELRGWIDAGDLRAHCHVLGPRKDVPRLTAALDLFTSSSVGEAFPNVIGEAMACGVPCVVTDVGDSARIVGETGKAVAPSQPHLMTHAWCDLLEIGAQGRSVLGRAARRRIGQMFSLPSVVVQYEHVYRQVAAAKRDHEHRHAA